MKKYLILLLFIFLNCSCEQEKMYCDKVIEKYRTSAGYKVKGESHIVFYSDSLKRNIDLTVSDNIYANYFLKDNICFSLFEYQTK